jgi:hypothetical protein
MGSFRHFLSGSGEWQQGHCDAGGLDASLTRKTPLRQETCIACTAINVLTIVIWLATPGMRDSCYFSHDSVGVDYYRRSALNVAADTNATTPWITFHFEQRERA